MAIETIVTPFDLSMTLICSGCVEKVTRLSVSIKFEPSELSKFTRLPEATMSLNEPTVLGTPSLLMCCLTRLLQ